MTKYYYIAPTAAGAAAKTPAPITDRTYHDPHEAHRVIKRLCENADLSPSDFIVYRLNELRKGSRFAY